MKHGSESSGASPLKKKLNLDNNRFSVLPDEADTSGDGMVTEIAPDRRPQISHSGPPEWFQAYESRQRAEFKAFESRQEAKFEAILGRCREEHEGMALEINLLKDQIEKLNKTIQDAENKIDDLENRGRRNNLVLYRVPEGNENKNCMRFVEDILAKAGLDGDLAIQRAHRTGKLKPPNVSKEVQGNAKVNPRPIHVGFASFLSKEQAKKALIGLFREKKEGLNFAVSDDYSVRVQKMRKAKVAEVQRLRKEGKEAYLVYPAEIVIKSKKP